MKPAQHLILLCFLTACSLSRAGMSATPVTIILPTRSSTAPMIASQTATRTFTATLTSTQTPTVTPTLLKTPFTPTLISEPYFVDVIDWELVEALSPPLCASCGEAKTTLKVPRGLSIAVLRVYIQGDPGSGSRLTTDLLYPSPDELECERDKGDFCGIIFGQIYMDFLTLSAEYVAGEQHQLIYLVTFQQWAGEDP